MRTNLFLLLTVTSMFSLTSCKKEDTQKPQITFTNNIAEGTASANGEYIITGHISSAVRLDKVVLTKEGQTTPFLIDETTAKNKNEFDFSYLVTGITTNTYIIVDVYDQGGGKISLRFLIRK